MYHEITIKKDFTKISNHILRDGRLSPEAIHLFLLLKMAHHDVKMKLMQDNFIKADDIEDADVNVSKKTLEKYINLQRKNANVDRHITKCFNELRAVGYALLRAETNAKGQHKSYYDISDYANMEWLKIFRGGNKKRTEKAKTAGANNLAAYKASQTDSIIETAAPQVQTAKAIKTAAKDTKPVEASKPLKTPSKGSKNDPLKPYIDVFDKMTKALFGKNIIFTLSSDKEREKLRELSESIPELNEFKKVLLSHYYVTMVKENGIPKSGDLSKFNAIYLYGGLAKAQMNILKHINMAERIAIGKADALFKKIQAVEKQIQIEVLKNSTEFDYKHHLNLIDEHIACVHKERYILRIAGKDVAEHFYQRPLNDIDKTAKNIIEVIANALIDAAKKAEQSKNIQTALSKFAATKAV